MHRVLALILFILAALPVRASEVDMPVFEKGLWHFKREIVYAAGRNRLLPNASTILVRESTRCVDPTVTMREIFSSTKVGSCSPEKPEKNDNRYVFPLRCDFVGPSRTEIVIRGANSYTETNESHVLKQKDIVTADRIGDCSN